MIDFAPSTSDEGVDRKALLRQFRALRERSRHIFDCVSDEAYFQRPIPLRNPIVFYEGHLPGFAVNTLVKSALGKKGIDEELEILFARGIDPADEASVNKEDGSLWPSRKRTREYAQAAYDLLEVAIARDEIEVAGDPKRDRAAVVHTILEHEAMHHETLLYMLHRLPHELKNPLAAEGEIFPATIPEKTSVVVPAGTATLGREPSQGFGWDNEFPTRQVVVEPFSIDVNNVTNEEFLRFVEAGGYRNEELWSAESWSWIQHERVEHPLFWERRDRDWLWRGMFQYIDLPGSWPVYVSQAEAAAYARWKSRRLMTETEFHRAAFGTPAGEERLFPWGDEQADATRGNFDFQRYDPVCVGAFEEGRSAWGIHDLMGNGWEWTSSLFEPFPGFEPMANYPQYSADFFDSAHLVMKGASPVTSSLLVRRSFRNWFRPTYPYVYATFRCVNNI